MRYVNSHYKQISKHYSHIQGLQSYSKANTVGPARYWPWNLSLDLGSWTNKFYFGLYIVQIVSCTRFSQQKISQVFWILQETCAHENVKLRPLPKDDLRAHMRKKTCATPPSLRIWPSRLRFQWKVSVQPTRRPSPCLPWPGTGMVWPRRSKIAFNTHILSSVVYRYSSISSWLGYGKAPNKAHTKQTVFTRASSGGGVNFFFYPLFSLHFNSSIFAPTPLLSYFHLSRYWCRCHNLDRVSFPPVGKLLPPPPILHPIFRCVAAFFVGSC